MKRKERDNKLSTIYSRCLITRNIILPITAIGKNIKNTIEENIRNNYESKCLVEGFIQTDSTKIISHSCGLIQRGTNILFTVDNAGRIVIGPSIVHERFTTAKRVRAFNNNGLPYPGSPDEANLMMISSNFSVNRFESKENEAAILNHRFTFPNFLSGDMLLLKKTNGVERFADSTIIGRPFASETGDGAELWAKYYGDTYFVPYDDTIYIFPAGVSLLVRADDMVMYYHSELGVLSFSPPIGSYYIKPPGLDLLPNVFRESARYTHILEEVQAQVDDMVRGGLT